MSNRFGKLLLQFREQNDFNQQMLAERLGVAQPTISNWELGKSVPDEDEQQAILKKLKISGGTESQLGDWLRRARSDKGWTQAELAQKADLSKQTISLIETGVITNPQRRTIETLKKTLGEEPAVEEEKPQVIPGVGEYQEIDTDSIDTLPKRPGIYILNAVNDKGHRKRPVYVGTSDNLRRRMGEWADDKRGVWWFRKPIVGLVGYVEIDDEALRKQIEKILTKGLDPLLIFNDQNVDSEG
jgi:transcriptional regulator with XRE-family HTH domain